MNDLPEPTSASFPPASPMPPASYPPPTARPAPPLPGSLAETANTIGNHLDYTAQTLQTQLPRTSTMAILCMVAAIAGWSFAPFVGAVLALICGRMAKAEIARSNGQLAGGKLVNIAMIVALIELALAALGILTAFLFVIVPLLLSLLGHR